MFLSTHRRNSKKEATKTPVYHVVIVGVRADAQSLLQVESEISSF